MNINNISQNDQLNSTATQVGFFAHILKQNPFKVLTNLINRMFFCLFSGTEPKNDGELKHIPRSDIPPSASAPAALNFKIIQIKKTTIRRYCPPLKVEFLPISAKKAVLEHYNPEERLQREIKTTEEAYLRTLQTLLDFGAYLEKSEIVELQVFGARIKETYAPLKEQSDIFLKNLATPISYKSLQAYCEAHTLPISNHLAIQKKFSELRRNIAYKKTICFCLKQAYKDNKIPPHEQAISTIGSLTIAVVQRLPRHKLFLEQQNEERRTLELLEKFLKNLQPNE